MVEKIGIHSVSCIMLMLCFFAVGAESFRDIMLIDFERDFKPHQVVVDQGEARRIMVAGNQVLELKAQPGEAVKIRLFPTQGTWNLKKYVNLMADISNLSSQEVSFRMLIKDPGVQEESWYRPNLSHNGWVKPGETRIFPALLVRHKYKNKASVPSYVDRFPRMHGVPHAQMLVWFGVDVTQVSEVVFLLEEQPFAQTVRLDNIRGSRRASPELMEKNPDAFFPFIDVYGQYKHEAWPGKIQSDRDLIEAKKREAEELVVHPRPMVFNRYGGWKDGPSLRATGHFRVEKVEGRWWFVDPAGKLFWSLGCNAIGLQMSRVNIGDKAHFYDWIPERDDPVFGRYLYPQRDQFDSRCAVMHRKYGAAYREVYKDLSLRRVRSWGLNTLGGWSDYAENQPDALKMPYCVALYIRGRSVKPIDKMVDPFDPDFEQAVIRAVRREAASANDPFCIGYFDNNEIHWGENPLETVRQILLDNPADSPTRQALVSYLKERQTDVKNSDALLGFYSLLVDTYYRKCRNALREVAPHKLYLGNRIFDGAMRKEVGLAAATYCDVVSFNIYEKDLDAFNVRTKRDLPFFDVDKPFMVTEFNFGALDRGKFFTGIGYAADQRNRGENFVRYVKSGLRNPRCVGAHWYSYGDSPTGSRHVIAENANCGFVSSADSPYPELIKQVRKTGKHMYPYRYGEMDFTHD